ncbi:DUF4260 family protein [Nocardia inohanensis]|uniref:DUF4260 family protein n=1 Tax=Nocardia inohanensis TaxID=209246 RepID=UPI000A03CB13|nr:DUF4260 family protein [Nocardia inohanensis]
MTTIATTPATSTDTRPARRFVTIARKLGWAAWTLFLAAFAILEGVKHGGGAWAALATGLIAPDLTFFAAIGANEPVAKGQLPRKAVPFYNFAHRTWIPLALAVAYTCAAIDSPALFTLLLAWMLHIGIDRVAGYGLRTAAGFQRN